MFIFASDDFENEVQKEMIRILQTELLEKYDFEDIVISLKSSDVKMNYDAYKIVHERSEYPLHIGFIRRNRN